MGFQHDLINYVFSIYSFNATFYSYKLGQIQKYGLSQMVCNVWDYLSNILVKHKDYLKDQ